MQPEDESMKIVISIPAEGFDSPSVYDLFSADSLISGLRFYRRPICEASTPTGAEAHTGSWGRSEREAKKER
jgi:hypothetical protein